MTRRGLLGAAAAVLSGIACPAETPDAPPSADEQVTLINAMRSYAESYEAGLPNFICTQVTTHYESGTKRENWHKGDTVTAQLSFSNGQEHSAIKLINNKPAPPHVRPWRWSLSTEGEFDAALVRIFAEDSQAKFEWKEWEHLDGQRVAAFLFSISKENSTLQLTYFGVSAFVAFRGTVWAEPNKGQVLKLLQEAVDIPEELQMEHIQRLVQYEDVDISGKRYLLPIRAEIVDKTHHGMQRNVIEFREYRKFEAESTLTFGDPKP